MYKFGIIAVVLLTLTGCKSEEQKKSEWINFCVDGEFTQKQCNVLYSMKKEASDNADSNAAMTGVAIGMSAGRR